MLRIALFWLRPPATNPQQWHWELMPRKQPSSHPAPLLPAALSNPCPSSSELTQLAEHSPHSPHPAQSRQLSPHRRAEATPQPHISIPHPNPAFLLTDSLNCQTLENKRKKGVCYITVELSLMWLSSISPSRQRHSAGGSAAPPGQAAAS